MKTHSVFSIISSVSCLTIAIVFVVFGSVDIASAQQPDWIWSPKQDILAAGESHGECYYRKKFTLIRPETAELEFSAGDEFEVYINSQLVSRGQSYGSPTTVDVASLLQPGVNLIAAKVRHNSSNQIGLNAKLRVKEKGETRFRSLTTDATWKTKIEFADAWQKNGYNDIGWLNATTAEVTLPPAENKALANDDRSVEIPASENKKVARPTTNVKPAVAQPIETAQNSAEPGKKVPDAIIPDPSLLPEQPSSLAIQATPPPAGEVVKKEKSSDNARFTIDPEFVVQQVLSPAETGSLIAMEINEFGQLLLSRENGPLLIADTTKPAGHPDRVRTYCQEVNSCQGILPLNGSVYVTAQGPEGLGLYLLTDKNHDGTIDQTKKLLGFTGELGEHGPHGIQLGPDGMIYVIIGNGSQLIDAVAETSPYKNWYEGDLIPRYEDPGGHAAGIQAPGGTIIRMAPDGSKIERVAGGIRNAYDLVFDELGNLFVHDSDMESDEGTSWYRPTNIYQVTAGAEMGWRSGWSKFPNHFIDQTPPICDTGRGSPTGAVMYQHLQFPVRYQNTLFFADWSEGRIIALRKKPVGAGYVGQPETFLAGKPLNVCDLAIAEDGGMYFCTGGRGTAGGVYRVVWNGTVPAKVMQFESDLAKVIRHPQPNSAWARQSISELKKTLGKNWDKSLIGVADEARNPNKFRIRALQMMVLYGPAPSDDMLKKLAMDPAAEIRAETARMCGLKGGAVSTELLAVLIGDKNPMVRTVTCESYLRLGTHPNLDALTPLLASLDRTETSVARRLLETMPIETWESVILNTDDTRVFIQGAVALMNHSPTLERSYQVLAKASNVMDGFVNDLDFVDLLRVMELALVQGNVEASRVPGLAARIGNEFPSANSIINQELARLMAYLKIGDLDGRLGKYLLADEVPLVDRVHAALYLQAVGTELSSETRLAVIDCLESARNADDVGGSYALYLKHAVDDVATTLTNDEIETVLQNGHRWPNAVLATFFKMPEQLDEATTQRVIQLDQAIQNADDVSSRQLRLGVIALLARSHDESAMEYLRQLWQTEEARRNDIVIGLAQQPDGDNWPYLVSSIPILDDMTGREVAQKLSSIPRRPREPQHFRDAIELGYRLRTAGAGDVVKLLEHWSGESPPYTTNDWQSQLATWNSWFQQNWPEQSLIVNQTRIKSGKYSVDEMLSFIEKNGLGDPERGQHLFTTTQCALCHQYGATGQNIGPNLNHLSQRFSMREVLEATLEPSRIISDRYQSKVIVTIDGDQFSGMSIKQADGGYVVLLNDGKRVRVPAEDIEAINDSTVSAMPNGLLDRLTPTEIADLVAFVMQPETDMAQRNDTVESR